MDAAELAEPFCSMREGRVAHHFDLKPGRYRITPAQKTFVFAVADRGLEVCADGIVGCAMLSSILIEPAKPAREPPVPPQVNRLIARDGTCYLEWSPSPSPHVAGYNVFRADSVDAHGNYRDSVARVAARPHVPNDDQLIEMTGQAAFQFFVKECDPVTFLTRDKNVAHYISCASVSTRIRARSSRTPSPIAGSIFDRSARTARDWMCGRIPRRRSWPTGNTVSTARRSSAPSEMIRGGSPQVPARTASIP